MDSYVDAGLMNVQRYLNKKTKSKYLRITIFTILAILYTPVLFVWCLWDGGLKEFIDEVVVGDNNPVSLAKEYWKSMEGNNEKAD